MSLRAITALPDARELSFFHDTLAEWSNALLAKGSKAATTRTQCATVRHCFLTVLGIMPWRADRSDIDRYSGQFARTQAISTLRGKQSAIRQYLAYLSHPAYPWAEICLARFGVRPRQLFTRENSVHHKAWDEARPERRNLTEDEVQRFAAQIRSHMHESANRRVKGSHTAARDYALYMVLLCWGLRCNEAAALIPQDLCEAPQSYLKERHGIYDTIHVREGKAYACGPPRDRKVVATPLFECGVDVLRWYCESVRPTLRASRYLFATESGGRLNSNSIGKRFAAYRDAAHLDEALTAHALRHTYITWLVEDDYDAFFVKNQAGHDFLATTEGYTHIVGDHARTLLDASYAELCKLSGALRS